MSGGRQVPAALLRRTTIARPFSDFPLLFSTKLVRLVEATCNFRDDTAD
jgi:hypothetical protein